MILYPRKHTCQYASHAANSLRDLAAFRSARGEALWGIRSTHIRQGKRSHTRAQDTFLSLRIVGQRVPNRSKYKRGYQSQQHVACKSESNNKYLLRLEMAVIQLPSCHIAIVVLAFSDSVWVPVGMSWAWNHSGPGKNHAKKAGEMVDTIVTR